MEKYHFSDQEKSILESLKQPFAIYQFVNKTVVTLILSDGFCDLFGYEDREQAYYDMDHDMYKMTHPDDTAKIADAAYRFATEDRPYDVVYRTKRINSDEDYHIVHASGKHVYSDSGIRLAQVWYTDEGEYSEKTDQKKSEFNRKFNQTLREDNFMKASQFNYLTGLPSMTYFFDLAEIGKDAIIRGGNSPAMLFIDLSGMKFYNAKYGFAEGDKLLQTFSRALVETFNNENCCHISGDHFAVYTKEEGLKDVLEGLFDRCSKLNHGDFLPVRVGIYPMSLEEVPVSIACDRAKFACDGLRNTFESGYNYYDKELRDDAERRQYVLTNLDRAIEERWIKVYFQPIVRAVNGRVCEEEALARWIDPERGFLSPGFFIPFLEESGLIYKLDIYMVDQVIEKMKYQQSMGFKSVPHSVNFSRSDFDACDIVEEVRRRVDAAGIGRNMITIEITESAIGSNFDFMKEQIDRFRQLGFPVWMDDFGSGYSSLDVLSSIQFDLIKFDMIFMRKFEAEEKRKIVLTELMRMATSLGVDTVCEGVETAGQVKFLQEIGCSKLQGFYFERPIPLEKILEKYEKKIQIGYEDPASSEYYEAMGRINIYDLSAIANNGEDDRDFHNFFNTLPMGIFEMEGDNIRLVRGNPSFKEFGKRFFGADLTDMKIDCSTMKSPVCISFGNFIRQCCATGNRLVYDEIMEDGSTVHSFARRISTDPVMGKTAVAVAILSVTEAKDGANYATIARALAADYYNIYYVDMETGHFIEYSSPIGEEKLAVERHGEHFFEISRRDTMTRIYEEDRVPFLINFTKENIEHALDENGVFTATYRLIDTGEPVYAHMKITRMPQDKKHIILGVSIIDSQMKKKEINDLIQREEIAYARIMALSGGYLGLYTVDPSNNSYFEFNASSEYNHFGFAKTGDDFFRDAVVNGEKIVYHEDLPYYMSRVTKESILSDIEENGLFQLQYRIMMNGRVEQILLKIVPVIENGTEKLIVGARIWKSRTK